MEKDRRVEMSAIVLESFYMLMKLDQDGAVKEIPMHPEIKVGTCAREMLLRSASSPPPRGVLGEHVPEADPLS